jgi:D-glycero-D-manno-heptose 1,7-bisphosphate phosphatase
MNKIAFLDRDGVLNKELGRYVLNANEWLLSSNIIPVLNFLKSRNYIFIVTTNQGGIARGLFTEADLKLTHEKMIQEFEAHEIKFTDIFYCSHHPRFGMCLCRKPAGGMLERGLAKYNGDLKHCLMIGDSDRDTGAATSLGIPCFKIKSNQIDEKSFLNFFNRHFTI